MLLDFCPAGTPASLHHRAHSRHLCKPSPLCPDLQCDGEPDLMALNVPRPFVQCGSSSHDGTQASPTGKSRGRWGKVEDEGNQRRENEEKLPKGKFCCNPEWKYLCGSFLSLQRWAGHSYIIYVCTVASSKRGCRRTPCLGITNHMSPGDMSEKPLGLHADSSQDEFWNGQGRWDHLSPPQQTLQTPPSSPL